MPRLTAADALMMLAKTKMRTFNKAEWAAYAGCESLTPMYGIYNDPVFGECEVVLDDANLLIVHAGNLNDGGSMFKLR